MRPQREVVRGQPRACVLTEPPPTVLVLRARSMPSLHWSSKQLRSRRGHIPATVMDGWSRGWELTQELTEKLSNSDWCKQTVPNSGQQNTHLCALGPLGQESGQGLGKMLCFCLVAPKA